MPHTAFAGLARMMVACVLAVAALGVHAAEPAARVVTFSPQGLVPALQQVRATFSEPMVPLGKVTAPGPFDVDCALQGNAHWVDDRTWVMDVPDQEFNGQACEFRVKAALKSLAGHEVAEPRVFRFKLPVLTDEVKRRVQTIYPPMGAPWITEDQAFLLTYSHALGKTRPDVRCEAPGRPEAQAVHLPMEVRDELKRQLRWMQLADDRSEAVRCPFTLAPGSRLTLRHMRGSLKPDQVAYTVRPLPAVTVDCRRLAATGDCAANFPIALQFNAAMPEAALRAIRLEAGADVRPREVSVQPGTVMQAASSRVVFAPAFKPQAEYRIRWPEQALADDAGRPLQREGRPSHVKTLPLLGMAYFPTPVISLRPLQADNAVPVALQGDATRPAVREQYVANDKLLDRDLMSWTGVSENGFGVGHFFRMSSTTNAMNRPFNSQAPLSLNGAVELPLEITASAPRQGRVPLRGAGLHLLELQAYADKSQVGPVYDSVAVLLTRMAVHLKVGEENSAAWVTRLDNGEPVAGAAVRMYDCSGALAWQGTSDAQGVAHIDRKSLGFCIRQYHQPDLGVTAVVRHTWPDGVWDASLTNSRWERLLDPASQGLRQAWWVSPVRAHTVLDRSLFKPGETVSMRHVLRREGNLGLAPLDAGTLPSEAKIMHGGSGKEWSVPLAWATPGDGTSTFQLPADAPLGRYSVALQVNEPTRSMRSPVHYTAEFAVEAFRLPAMLGSVAAPAPKLIFGTAPTLKLALHYADGGAAQNWPVTLRVYAQARGYRGPAVLSDYPSGNAWGLARGDAEPAQLLLKEQSLELDAQGHAQLDLPDLPARALPYRLHAELSYQDPNGEAQTVSQDFDVQPSLWSVGVRTLGTVSVKRPLQVQGLVVDEAGARLAGRPARIVARYSPSYGAGTTEDLGEVCQGLTDAQGLLACPFVPGKPGQYQFQVTAQDPAGRVATAYSQGHFVGVQPMQAQPLSLNTDKALYREGEVATLAVSSPFKRARVWLTLERQGILESRVLTLDAADSRIRLPIRREWAGNVAVSVLALDTSAAAPATAVAAGITELVVSTEARALRISLTPDKPRYQPGEHAKVRIHVATADGKPLPAARRVTFVAVDEALLSLKDNDSWQLLAQMLRPRMHGVQTTSGAVMNPPVDEAALRSSAETALMELMQRAEERARSSGNVMQASPVAAPAPALAAKMAAPGEALERVEVTGSKLAVADAAPARPTRKLLDSLLTWQADVPLDANGNAMVSFTIKDALSRFRLVAVASAGVEDFGTGSAVLDVMKDLQLTAGLPPQVRDDDRFAALVTVRNTSSAAITLDASATLSGQPTFPVRTLRLAAGESRQLSWDVRVPLGAKALDWTFSAKEQGHSNRQDVLQVAQQVLPAVPVTVQAATLAQVNGTFDVPAFGFDSTEASSARVNVQLLPTLAGNLGGVRDWLALYPYRCLEQTASRAVGMHDRAAWDAAMATLPQYLDADGLANYFPHMPSQPWPGSDTLTSYLLDIAHAAGWPVPEAERNRMLAALEGFVAGRVQRTFWAPRKDDLARKVAAMATLARYDRLKPAQLAGVRIDPDEWTTAMLIDWLTLQRKLGGNQAAQEETQNALRARLTYQGRRMGFSTETRDYWWWLMSHGDVDAARLMLTVADLPDWKADLPRLLAGLLARQNHGAWATTTANAWGTLAVDGFARVMEPVPVAGTTRITLGTQQQTVNWAQPKQAPFDAKLDKPTDALHIQHQGPGAPWASVEVRAAVPLKEARAAGYSISRSITPVQQRVPGQWHVGDTLRVRLTMRAQADMSWVVVDDPVPAGASLLGNGLGRDSAAAQAGEQRTGYVWPLYQARDYTSFKSFYRYVPRGEFSVEYTLRLNNPGQFTLPPTRVEAMYAPEVFGEVPNAAIGIEP